MKTWEELTAEFPEIGSTLDTIAEMFKMAVLAAHRAGKLEAKMEEMEKLQRRLEGEVEH